MSFAIGNRVKVTDESSQYRHHLGTVESINNALTVPYFVRLDGDAIHGQEQFTASQLQGTSLPCPLTYPS